MPWGYVGPLFRRNPSQSALPPPLELCTQRRPLLPVPEEELTRSIRWSLDWQRACRVTQGRVILSQQLVG